MAGGDDRRARLWDAASGKKRATLAGHRGSVLAAAFAPDQPLAATGSEDERIVLWDVKRRSVRKFLDGHESAVRALAFSPDGVKLVSAGDDKTLRIWETSTAKLRDTLFAHGSEIRALAFSSDGSLIASAGRDQTVKLWDAGDGGLRATYRGHAGSVDAVAFSPDGKIVAAAGEAVLLHRRADSASLTLRTFVVDGEEVGLAHTSNGLFEGDPRALSRVLFRVGPDVTGADLLGAEQLHERFYREGLGKAFVTGQKIVPPEEIEQGIALPPSVEFVEPVPDEVSAPTVRVTIRAASRGGGVSEIRLFANGEQVRQLADAGDRQELDAGVKQRSFTVNLIEGENVIEAEAFNVLGRARSPRTSVTIERKGG